MKGGENPHTLSPHARCTTAFSPAAWGATPPQPRSWTFALILENKLDRLLPEVPMNPAMNLITLVSLSSRSKDLLGPVTRVKKKKKKKKKIRPRSWL